mmetsp:Transcript_19106/g.45735  ORF Transcript_19106/g.45735 Transcript_19106/m.45735 type:complete len:258 (+) Transcript_19106:352-1125(+)
MQHNAFSWPKWSWEQRQSATRRSPDASRVQRLWLLLRRTRHRSSNKTTSVSSSPRLCMPTSPWSCCVAWRCCTLCIVCMEPPLMPGPYTSSHLTSSRPSRSPLSSTVTRVTRSLWPRASYVVSSHVSMSFKRETFECRLVSMRLFIRQPNCRSSTSATSPPPACRLSSSTCTIASVSTPMQHAVSQTTPISNQAKELLSKRPSIGLVATITHLKIFSTEFCDTSLYPANHLTGQPPKSFLSPVCILRLWTGPPRLPR